MSVPRGSLRPRVIDKDAITNYADQHAEPHSLGKCAAYCRRAFEAGGVDTNGHPIDAKDWGPTLLKNGATVISPDGYKPQKADVAVFAGSDACTSVNDSVVGNWRYGYDMLNRLTSATAGANTGSYASHYGCWTYDAFGNRTAQSMTTTSCATTPLATAQYDNNNRMLWSSTNSLGYIKAVNSSHDLSGTAQYAYSASGNMLYDGSKSYAYDADNRVCAVVSGNVSFGASASSITKYIYGADGERVAAGTGTILDCTYATFAMTREYVHSGKGIATEFSVSGATETVKYTNVYTGGKLLATYQGTASTQFNFTDWLGTKRVEANYQGVATSTSNSLPFGDYLAVSGADSNENHFTGKERDAESNLDYFGARYYNSSFGRFIRPDWSSGAEAVPYAKLDDPQSLNLYAYVRNNPLISVDVEGHLPSVFSILGYDEQLGESVARYQSQVARDAQADQNRSQPGLLGAVPGYPETGKTSWRSQNDQIFIDAAEKYNQDNGIEEGSPLYMSPFQLKVQAMIESGGAKNKKAFLSDPLQVNNSGDWTDKKTEITSLTKGQKMTPEISADASVKWLFYKATMFDKRGNDIGFRNMHDTLRNYNGNVRVYEHEGGIQHRDWYANTIISLTKKGPE